MSLKKLNSVELKGKRILLRTDFNVPMDGEKVGDISRLKAALKTILYLHKKGAKIIILSHLGRPTGKREEIYSLRPVAAALSTLLGKNIPVHFSEEVSGSKASSFVDTLKDGEVLVLENLRFYEGEEKNDPKFAAELANLGDIYVNDAFSASHRAHASIEEITHLLPSYPGLFLESELKELEKYLDHSRRPMLAILGGAKISTKLALLKNLIQRVDMMVLGGGMANTFLYAQGYEVGLSLCEPSMKEKAWEILTAAEQRGCKIILPQDVVVASEVKEGVESGPVLITHIERNQFILDVGPLTVDSIKSAIDNCKTVVWNGPLGLTEIPPFDQGTSVIARYIAKRTEEGLLCSVSGGGDTAAILNKVGCFNQFSYVSMAGGAFLEWLEGQPLPGIEALKRDSLPPKSR